MYWQPYSRSTPTWIWAVGSLVLAQSAFGREARQVVFFPSPRARAGTQVGEVRTMMSPFFTGIVVSRANWAVIPKYGSSSTSGVAATRRYFGSTGWLFFLVVVFLVVLLAAAFVAPRRRALTLRFGFG